MAGDEDNRHNQTNKQHLKQGYPPVPSHRAQLSEIDFAKRDKEDEEHEQWQDGGKERPHRRCRLVQLGREGKHEIKHRSRSHSHGQRPVLDESYNVHNEAAKVRLFLEKSKKIQGEFRFFRKTMLSFTDF